MRYSLRSDSVLSAQSRLIPSTPDADNTRGFTGGTPSTESNLLPTRDVALPGTGKVLSAALPALSVMTAPATPSESVALMSSWFFRSPLATT